MGSKFFKVLLFITVTLNIFLVISYFVYPVIGDDSGFFVAIARELYNGKIYFHEIGISYNPLSIIFFGIPYLFVDNPNYIFHLAINILFVLGSSALLYNILKTFSSSKLHNLFFSSFFILLSLVLDGKYVMLEPVSVFFQLVAVYYYVQYLIYFTLKEIFLVGFFISLAFLSKQFGLFIAIPIGLHMLISNRLVFKNILTLLLGSIIPLGFFFAYLFYFGMTFSEFLNNILGKGIKLDVGNGTGIGTTFFSHPLDFIYVLFFNLYALLIPFLLFKYYKKLDAKWTLFFLAALSSLSVLIFANYWHYYQYIIPFWIILFVFLYQEVIQKNFKFIIALLFFASVSFLGLYSVLSFKGKKNAIAKQEMTTRVVSTFIPPESEVYLDGLSPAYYYTCKLKSINLEKIGFAFPGYFYPKTIMNNLNPGAYLVVSENKLQAYKDFISDCSLTKMEANNQVYYIIMKKCNIDNI